MEPDGSATTSPEAPNLAGILALVGPENRAEFLTRLTGDLAGVAAGLATRDPDAVRRAAHVLIALAGALGAGGLLAQAHDLHAAATAGHLPAPNLDRAIADLGSLRRAVAPEAVP